MECEFRKYQMFDGKMKVFRSEGGAVKTDDEKRQMAEKHRFKKNREFKQRLEEQEQNEDGDIRSFTFHRHNPFGEKETRKPRRREDDDTFGKTGKPGKTRKASYPEKFGKPGKFGKPAKSFGGKRNRFDDDED